MYNKIMNLREQLKTQTMQAHHDIESNSMLKNIMSPSLDLELYTEILKKYLGFFRPLEAELQKIPDISAEIPHFQERLRTPALIQDLKALGLSDSQVAEIPDCPNLPDLRGQDISQKAKMYGISYVLEGSTLGGSMIAKKLSQNPNLKMDAINFYSGHREKTGIFWQSFIKQLETADDQYQSDSRWRLQVTSSASETFKKLDYWLV